jgi:hypothetical protein
MAMIEISLRLELHEPTCTPEARVWLDLHPDAGLSSEMEVPLWESGRHEWRGRFSVDERACQELAYRVGLFAHADAEWSLSFRKLQRDADLLVDGDRLIASKCWLVGYCNLQPSEKPEAPASRDSKSGQRRRPRLTLLRGGASAASA